MTETPVGGMAKVRPVVDFHAHVLVPDVYAVAAEHNIRPTPASPKPCAIRSGNAPEWSSRV